jgi:hypothetical protein
MYLFQILFVIFSQKYIELNISQRIGAVEKSHIENIIYFKELSLIESSFFHESDIYDDGIENCCMRRFFFKFPHSFYNIIKRKVF